MRWLSTGERGTVDTVQKAEPLCELRVWLPKSTIVWLEEQAVRRDLKVSPWVRMHFAAVRERQEKAA